MSNIQPVYAPVQSSQVLAGTQSVYGAVGSKDTSVAPAFVNPGTMLAPPSGVEYKPAKPRCCWDNYKCKANPSKGTPLCFGHLQHFLKHGDGLVKGDEAQRLLIYKAQFQELEKQRLAEKAAEKEAHWAEHGPKDEVTDES
jgi:hypothetical protein